MNEGEGAAAGRLSLLAVSSILGYTDLAKRILAAGHDVNLPPEWPGSFRTTRSMLSFAAEYGHIGLVTLFLRHGAEFCPERDGGFSRRRRNDDSERLNRNTSHRTTPTRPRRNTRPNGPARCTLHGQCRPRPAAVVAGHISPRL
ncbi:hypothetical protein BDW68DRAFT_171604 [Aspergillus falconensis]